ncbi:MAG TPA: hypothetical protein PKZ35_03745 [Gammaproteobacteria bacterium]|nr:hypothetical protein [Gammaproteobacteria bacterium]
MFTDDSKIHQVRLRHYAVAIALSLLTAILVVAAQTPFGVATTPDSLSYLDIATNMAEGLGPQASDFSLTTPGARGVVDQRSWPPMYSFLLSRVIRHASDTRAVAWLSMLMLSGGIFLVFLLLSSAMPWWLALFSAMAFSMTLPVLTVYTYGWSETLFLPLLLMVMWIGSRYMSAPSSAPGFRLLLLALFTITLVMLAYTRYIGIVLALLLPLVLLFNRRSRFDLLGWVGLSLGYVIAVGSLLLTNHDRTGHLSGNPRSPSTDSLQDILQRIHEASAVLFPNSLSALSIATLVAVILAWFRWRYPTPSTEIRNIRMKLLLAATVAISLLATLVILRVRVKFDDLDVRLLSPVFVAVFCLFALVPWAVRHRGSAVVVQFIAGFAIAAAAVHGYQHLLTVPDSWSQKQAPQHRSSTQGMYNNFTLGDDPARAYLSELMRPGGILVIDQPLVWEFRSGFRSMQKPDSYDVETLEILNALPAGSLLVAERRDVDQLRRVSGIDLGVVVDLGKAVAIPLPLGSRLPVRNRD